MVSVIVFLSGLLAMIAGAFLRFCAESIPAEFARSWCGNAPPPDFFAAAHSHCAVCAAIAAGLALVAIAPMFIPVASRLTSRPVHQRCSDFRHGA